MGTAQSRASHEDIQIFYKEFLYEENKSFLNCFSQSHIFLHPSQSY